MRFLQNKKDSGGKFILYYFNRPYIMHRCIYYIDDIMLCCHISYCCSVFERWHYHSKLVWMISVSGNLQEEEEECCSSLQRRRLAARRCNSTVPPSSRNNEFSKQVRTRKFKRVCFSWNVGVSSDIFATGIFHAGLSAVGNNRKEIIIKSWRRDISNCTRRGITALTAAK